MRDLGLLLAHNDRVVGTPEQITDRSTEWHDAGVDRINVVNVTRPGPYEEFIEHVTPDRLTHRSRGGPRGPLRPPPSPRGRRQHMKQGRTTR